MTHYYRYKVFESNPDIFKYPVIVVECTFLFDHLQQAEQSDHIHWFQIEKFVSEHPEVTFVSFLFDLREDDLEDLNPL
jgi:hypothetical protein